MFDSKLIPELVKFKEQTYNEAIEIFDNSKFDEKVNFI